MKTGLAGKQKVTLVYFNEHDDLANTDAYAKEHPALCPLTEDDKHGQLQFEIN